MPSSSADTLAMRDLAQYQTIDDDFVLEVRLPLPERVPPVDITDYVKEPEDEDNGWLTYKRTGGRSGEDTATDN